MGCPRRLHAQFHLVVAFILLFLFPYVRSDHFFIQSHRGDKVASCPEDLSGEVPCATPKLPGNRYRALAFDVSHYVGYRVLRWNTQAHVYVIRHQVPFYNFRRFVPGQLPEYLSKVPSQTAKNRLLPSLRDEYHVVFAIPPRMRKTLVLLTWISPSLLVESRESKIPVDRRIGQTLRSPPAKPGVYLT